VIRRIFSQPLSFPKKQGKKFLAETGFALSEANSAPILAALLNRRSLQTEKIHNKTRNIPVLET